MDESPTDRARAENILTFTGTSIALSTIIFFFSSNSYTFSFSFGPPVSALTIIYHSTILILTRRHRHLPNASPYPIMRPAVGLAVFLSIMWLATTGFMIASLIMYESNYQWWDKRNLVTLWAQLFLAVVETGCMMSIVVLCARARKSLAAAEQERRIQI